AKNQEIEDDSSQRHSAAATPAIFLRRTGARNETALTENRSGNLQCADEEQNCQSRQDDAVAARHGACIGRHRVHRENQSASAARSRDRYVHAVGPWLHKPERRRVKVGFAANEFGFVRWWRAFAPSPRE